MSRWMVIWAICLAVFVFIDQIVYRNALPLLLTGFLVSQLITWALMHRRSPS